MMRRGDTGGASIMVWRGDAVREAIGRYLGPGAVVVGRPGRLSPSWLAGLPFGPDQFFLGSASGALGVEDLPLLLATMLRELPPTVRRLYHYDATWLGPVARAYQNEGFEDFVHRYSMQRRLPAPLAPEQRLRLLPFTPEAQELFAETYARCLVACQSPMSLEDVADPAAALAFQVAQDHGPDGRRWYLGLLDDGRPVGMALLDRYGPAPSDWVVSFLGTASDHRGLGYGRELLLRAAAGAARAGARKLHLAVCQTNEPALGLYRSAGFRTEETYRVFRRTV